LSIGAQAEQEEAEPAEENGTAGFFDQDRS
jgi:hypothetical protein